MVIFYTFYNCRDSLKMFRRYEGWYYIQFYSYYIRVSHQMLNISIFGQSYHANAKPYSCHSWTTGRVTMQLCMYQKSPDQLKRTITASGNVATPTKSHVVSYACQVTFGGCGLIWNCKELQLYKVEYCLHHYKSTFNKCEHTEIILLTIFTFSLCCFIT